jgi:hypothetical protein
MSYLINFEPPEYVSVVDVNGQNGWGRIGGPAASLFVSNVAPIEGTQSLRATLNARDLTTYARNLGLQIPNASDFSITGGVNGSNDGSELFVKLKLGAQDVWVLRLASTKTFPSAAPQEIQFTPTGGTPFVDNVQSPAGSVKWGVKISGGNVEFLRNDISQHITTISVIQYDRIEIATFSTNGLGFSGAFDIIQELLGPPQVPAAPVGVFAISRENYTVVSWDKVLRDSNGGELPTPVTRYLVSRATLLNSSDAGDDIVVDTTDANGEVDTIYIDTKPNQNLVYKIKSVVGIGLNMVESESSERAVATRSPSQIDDKKEVIDNKLLVWDEGNWGDTLWN